MTFTHLYYEKHHHIILQLRIFFSHRILLSFSCDNSKEDDTLGINDIIFFLAIQFVIRRKRILLNNCLFKLSYPEIRENCQGWVIFAKNIILFSLIANLLS